MSEFEAKILALLENLTAEVRALKAQSKPPALLLSFRRAAKLLRVDRATTLGALIRSGQLKTVKVNGHDRIPRAEIDRLAAEGFDRDAPAKRRNSVRSGASGVDVERAILALKI